MPSLRQIAIKTIAGEQLTAAERSKLTSAMLTQLAIGGYVELTMDERRQLSKAALAQLAMAGAITLTRSERDRLGYTVLAHLAITDRAQLNSQEYNRLSRKERTVLERRSAKPAKRQYNGGRVWSLLK